uniref:C-type lectin domain-containing protein n=1 Tax=Strix occidentalis caurina TaxID=311401 RepID=A0A8D0KW00_STROC
MAFCPVLTCGVSGVAGLEPCPDDWLYYKRKCYYNSGAVADWDSSQEACSDYGASLAVINSRQELVRCPAP